MKFSGKIVSCRWVQNFGNFELKSQTHAVTVFVGDVLSRMTGGGGLKNGHIKTTPFIPN